MADKRRKSTSPGSEPPAREGAIARALNLPLSAASAVARAICAKSPPPASRWSQDLVLSVATATSQNVTNSWMRTTVLPAAQATPARSAPAVAV